jgi:hypothetical protein
MTDENIVQNDSKEELIPEQVKAPAEEKMLKQSEVNEIVGRAKREAHDKAIREAEMKYAISNTQPAQQQAVSTQNIGGMQQLNDEQVRRLIMEQAHHMAMDAVARKTGDEIEHKISSVKEKYTDHEDTIKKLNLLKIAEYSPEFVYMINSLDNAGDVLYDLGKNPTKLAPLLSLSKTHPELAADSLRSLSESIKDNEKALKAQSPSDPLSQIKPSPTKTDNGSMTISDLRRQPNLRA